MLYSTVYTTGLQITDTYCKHQTQRGKLLALPQCDIMTSQETKPGTDQQEYTPTMTTKQPANTTARSRSDSMFWRVGGVVRRQGLVQDFPFNLNPPLVDRRLVTLKEPTLQRKVKDN